MAKIDNIEQLSKLAELHKNGVLSDKEFNNQKSKLLKKKKNWWLRIPIAIIGLCVGIYSLGNIHPSSGTTSNSTPAQLTDLPSCDSSDAQDMLAGAFKNNASANVATITLLSLTDQKQMTATNSPPERDCTATAFLNSGKQNILYKLYFANPNDTSTMLVEVSENE